MPVAGHSTVAAAVQLCAVWRRTLILALPLTTHHSFHGTQGISESLAKALGNEQHACLQLMVVQEQPVVQLCASQ